MSSLLTGSEFSLWERGDIDNGPPAMWYDYLLHEEDVLSPLPPQSPLIPPSASDMQLLNLSTCSPDCGPFMCAWNNVPWLKGSSLLSFPWLAPYLPSKSIQQVLFLGIHPIVLHAHIDPPSDEVHLSEGELHYERMTSFVWIVFSRQWMKWKSSQHFPSE